MAGSRPRQSPTVVAQSVGAPPHVGAAQVAHVASQAIRSPWSVWAHCVGQEGSFLHWCPHILYVF